MVLDAVLGCFEQALDSGGEGAVAREVRIPANVNAHSDPAPGGLRRAGAHSRALPASSSSPPNPGPAGPGLGGLRPATGGRPRLHPAWSRAPLNRSLSSSGYGSAAGEPP